MLVLVADGQRLALTTSEDAMQIYQSGSFTCTILQRSSDVLKFTRRSKPVSRDPVPRRLPETVRQASFLTEQSIHAEMCTRPGVYRNSRQFPFADGSSLFACERALALVDEGLLQACLSENIGHAVNMAMAPQYSATP
jgi:hypothetical protein